MSTGDFKECRDATYAFLKTAEWCCKDVDAMLSGNMYPGVTNAAFSCELGMKALMISKSTTGEFSKKHSLSELFLELPSDVQAKIKSKYSVAQEGLPDLPQFLSECGNSFIEWRYAFEKGVNINLTALFVFANAISDCLKEQE